MEDLMNIDIYELFGIPPTADERKIKKAYRKKALTCHPDKNPDNPQAASLFLQLSQALELLLDKSKRTAYDKHYNAKKAAAIRHQQLDSKCKKLKEDLEIKERLAQFDKSGCRTKEQRLSEEIERLRKEGSQQLKEEMESLRQTIYNETLLKTKAQEAEDSTYRLKIRWKSKKDDTCNGGYDNEKLIQLFSKYGNIAVLIVSKNKGGSALIEFETGESATEFLLNSTLDGIRLSPSHLVLHCPMSEIGRPLPKEALRKEVNCLALCRQYSLHSPECYVRLTMNFVLENFAELKAYNLEKGYPENPLKLSWLNGEPPPLRSCGTTDIKDNNVHNKVNSKCNESEPIFSPKNTAYNTREERNFKFGGDESDFEAFVFAKLREAEDRKKNSDLT